MAYCEKCRMDGYLPSAMFVRPGENLFIGPCCALPTDNRVGVPTGGTTTSQSYEPPFKVTKLQPDMAEYGLKLSNKGGIQAYLNYGGLQISYDRTAEEIRRWAVSQGFLEESARKTSG